MTFAVDWVNWFESLVPLLWWALALLTVVWLFASGTVERLFARASKVSAFGFDLEFSGDAAQRNRAVADEQFERLQGAIDREVDTLAQSLKLQSRHRRLVDRVVRETFGESVPVGYRSALHVPDAVFQERLYQAIDYYPQGDGGRGRRFSIRTGVIGLSWRREASVGPVDLGSVSVDEFVEHWGMTPDEAGRRLRDRKRWFAAVLIEDTKRIPLGVLYFDFDDGDVAGLLPDPDQITRHPEVDLAAEFQDRCHLAAADVGLVEALAELNLAIRERAPRLEIKPAS